MTASYHKIHNQPTGSFKLSHCVSMDNLETVSSMANQNLTNRAIEQRRK